MLLTKYCVEQLVTKVSTDSLLNKRIVYNTKLAKVFVTINALEVVTIHFKRFLNNLFKFLVFKKQLLKVLCSNVASAVKVFY